MNHKRVLRIYREEGLNLRRKRPRRRVAAAHRMDRPELFHIDQCWSMDFVADQLFNGRQIRALTVVDNLAENVLLLRLIVLQKGNRLWILWSNYDSVISVSLRGFKSIMAVNLFRRPLINGRIRIK